MSAYNSTTEWNMELGKWSPMEKALIFNQKNSPYE